MAYSSSDRSAPGTCCAFVTDPLSRFSRSVMLQRVSLAIILVLAYLAARHFDHIQVACLQCNKCSNWDNVSQCLEVKQSTRTVEEETCNESLAVNGKTSFCFYEIADECPQMVFKTSADMRGNGGEISKKWYKGKCVYLDPNKGRMKDYSKCYWERIRFGHDLLHEKSGFQVLGRSMIRRTCHCSKDLCNDVEGEGCRNRPDRPESNVCGPSCMQVSRDQMETPGEEKEEFRDKCPAMGREPKEGEEPKGRLYNDCGTDPGRWEPTLVGGLTYRHKCFWGHKDGVRGSATALLASHIYLMSAVGVLVAHALA